MIKSLYIQNFQSHEKASLEFTPGVNVIVGKSDSGKSAIIRALRWIRWNKPSGNSYRSNWGGETRVHLETEEGSVLRIKDKKDKYELKREEDRKTLFEAFGTSVPDEITSFLNLNEINLQLQLDSPYLLSKTSGEVAQHFNKVAHLSQIDKGQSAINSSIRTIEAQIKSKQKDIKDNQEAIQAYDYIERLEMETEVLEDLSKQSTRLTNSKHALAKVLSDISDVDERLEAYKYLLALESDIKDIDDLITTRNTLDIQKDTLMDLIVSIERINKKIEQKEALLQLETEVINILQLTDDRDNQELKIGDLASVLYDLEQVNKSIQETDNDIHNWSNKFEEEMGSVCILCGQTIKRK